MPVNFPNQWMEIGIQIQETPKTSKYYESKEICINAPISKLSKATEDFVRSKRKLICYIEGNPLMPKSKIFSRSLAGQKREEWYIQNAGKKKKENCQLRKLHPAKLSFKTEREIKAFEDKQKLREFITTRLTLEMLNEFFLLKQKDSKQHTNIRRYGIC